MLLYRSIQKPQGVTRKLLRVALLSSLASCFLSSSLAGQETENAATQIRQPRPRTLPTPNVEVPSDKAAEKKPPAIVALPPVTNNTASTSIVPPLPLPEVTTDSMLPSNVEPKAESTNLPSPLMLADPTSPVQPVAYRNAPQFNALEPPPGWNAVEKSIREKLESCDAMLRRGAIFSARQTCWKGLEELCQVIDLHNPQGKHVESLRRALVAMREEEDFYRYSNIQLAKPEVLANLCFAHETPVIRSLIDQNSEQPTTFNPLIAAQHYRSYARDQLVLACDHHPWAADLLYALGKALEKQAWEDRSRSALVHQHAELVYQAALETNPSQTLAATQLGYVLLQLDRPQEARDILARSLQSGPTAASLQNLAEACRRLNDQPGVQWCATQLPHAQQRQQGAAADIPFTEINPRQFAAISPPDATFAQGNPTGIPNITAPQGTGQRIATQAAQQSNPESNGTNGWIPSLWR